MGNHVALEASTTSWVVSSQSTTVQLVVKRAIDLLGAALLLAILLPVLVGVAVLVLVSSPGPVLFRQPRVGQRGRVFWMHKFRTMVHDAQPALHERYYRALVDGSAEPIDGKYKLVNDPRVTRIGRPLRQYSLDELPQLWNVLTGEMSLIGPRPPLAYEVELYDAREWLRLAVKPGLTGLWQVSGRSALNFEEMIDLDRYYVEHWSIWLDFVILFRTPLAVLAGKGV
jgi:lipopolysaccharide/colanic/teichoic acid biosynthesis glycosyltransferase